MIVVGRRTRLDLKSFELCFDNPVEVKLIELLFEEHEVERTQGVCPTLVIRLRGLV